MNIPTSTLIEKRDQMAKKDRFARRKADEAAKSATVFSVTL